MACGCCAVGSRVGGTPELVGNDERGLLFRSGEPAISRKSWLHSSGMNNCGVHSELAPRISREQSSASKSQRGGWRRSTKLCCAGKQRGSALNMTRTLDTEHNSSDLRVPLSAGERDWRSAALPFLEVPLQIGLHVPSIYRCRADWPRRSEHRVRSGSIRRASQARPRMAR